MNLMVLLFTCLIVALIASESDGKRKMGGNGRGRKGGNFGGVGTKRQVKSWCNNFEDDPSVFTACLQLTKNFENYMEQIKNNTKTYLEKQKAELEDVVKTACRNSSDSPNAWKRCKDVLTKKRKMQLEVEKGYFYQNQGDCTWVCNGRLI